MTGLRLAEYRLERAQKNLAAWDRKLVRAARAKRDYEAKVRYYERRIGALKKPARAKPRGPRRIDLDAEM